jgi:hypothetical protein
VANGETVTAKHLLALATRDPGSLFRDADTLVTSREGVTVVPFRAVLAALDGKSSFAGQVLYHLERFADDGIIAGKQPRTTDGSDLDARLAGIAGYLAAEIQGREP